MRFFDIMKYVLLEFRSKKVRLRVISGCFLFGVRVISGRIVTENDAVVTMGPIAMWVSLVCQQLGPSITQKQNNRPVGRQQLIV